MIDGSREPAPGVDNKRPDQNRVVDYLRHLVPRDGCLRYSNVHERLILDPRRGSPGRIAYPRNREGLIIITNSRVDLNSYLVPRPGVRLKLADLTDALPAWTLVKGINSRGDLIRSARPSYFNVDFDFLLERVR